MISQKRAFRRYFVIFGLIAIVVLAAVLGHLINSSWFLNKKIQGNGEWSLITRHVGSYHKLAVSGIFNIDLQAGEPGDIEIQADSNLLPYITTHVSNDKLTIGIKANIDINSTKTIHIIVPANQLAYLSHSGVGQINAKHLHTKNLVIKSSGVGDIHLAGDIGLTRLNKNGVGTVYVGDIDSSDLIVNASGVGSVTLVGGNVANCDFSKSGVGTLTANQLTCQHLVVSSSGLGDVDVRAISTLTAKVTGSSTISYYGKPDKINTEISGLGKLKAAD